MSLQCPKGYRSAYDELWSFVDHKGNKQWVWLALDVKTREIVGVYLGDRDEKAARKLWESLPPVYRQCAVVYTDFWRAYGIVIASIALRIMIRTFGKFETPREQSFPFTPSPLP